MVASIFSKNKPQSEKPFQPKSTATEAGDIDKLGYETEEAHSKQGSDF